jgi:hypothetical protein
MQNISPKRDVRFFGAYDETRRAGSQFEFPMHAAPSCILQNITADHHSNLLVFENSQRTFKRG